MKIVVEEQFDRAAFDVVENGLNQYNMDATGYHTYRRVSVLLRDDEGEVKGGALGGIWGEWLYVRYLWITEELRGQGFGSQMLALVEAEAIASKCRGIYLESYDFQAYSFYLRYGFEEVGKVMDFPPGYTFYYLVKRLA